MLFLSYFSFLYNSIYPVLLVTVGRYRILSMELSLFQPLWGNFNLIQSNARGDKIPSELGALWFTMFLFRGWGEVLKVANFGRVLIFHCCVGQGKLWVMDKFQSALFYKKSNIWKRQCINLFDLLVSESKPKMRNLPVTYRRTKSIILFIYGITFSSW